MAHACPNCGYKPEGMRKGERHPHAKLTAAQVISIFKSPLPNSDLAETYGMEVRAVQRIKSGQKWSSVTGKKFSPRQYRK